MWMWDTLQGYHQIGVEPDSQEKLAFAGPYAHQVDVYCHAFQPSKWAGNVHCVYS
jgi:hypothetical protein